MPATREELHTLQLAFERRHSDAARALADLMLVGSATLEKHGVRDQIIGEAFEAFVLATASTCGLTDQQLAAAVRALKALRATVAELDQLPD